MPATRGDPGFTSCLAGTPARESRRRVPPSALGGWDRDEVPKDPVHFLAPRPDAGGHNPRPDGTIFPMATRSTVCKFRLTLEERRALDADAGLSLPRGVLPDLRCSADPASARLGRGVCSTCEGPARRYSILLAILACRSSDHRSHRGRTTESNSPQRDEYPSVLTPQV